MSGQRASLCCSSSLGGWVSLTTPRLASLDKPQIVQESLTQWNLKCRWSGEWRSTRRWQMLPVFRFDELCVSDRSPSELARSLAITSNLLAHHLDVLAHAGVIERVV